MSKKNINIIYTHEENNTDIYNVNKLMRSYRRLVNQAYSLIDTICDYLSELNSIDTEEITEKEYVTELDAIEYFISRIKDIGVFASNYDYSYMEYVISRMEYICHRLNLINHAMILLRNNHPEGERLYMLLYLRYIDVSVYSYEYNSGTRSLKAALIANGIMDSMDQVYSDINRGLAFLQLILFSDQKQLLEDKEGYNKRMLLSKILIDNNITTQEIFHQLHDELSGIFCLLEDTNIPQKNTTKRKRGSNNEYGDCS